MLNKTQITPAVTYKTIDKSQFSSMVITGGVSALIPIFSRRGIDSTVTQCEGSSSDVKRIFGEVDARFGDFGHSSAINWTKGGLPAHVCRLVADDSERAGFNLGIRRTSFMPNTQPYYIRENKSYSAGEIVRDPVTDSFFLLLEDFDTSKDSFIVDNDSNIKNITKHDFFIGYKFEDVVYWINPETPDVVDFYQANGDIPENTGLETASWSKISSFRIPADEYLPEQSYKTDDIIYDRDGDKVLRVIDEILLGEETAIYDSSKTEEIDLYDVDTVYSINDYVFIDDGSFKRIYTAISDILNKEDLTDRNYWKEVKVIRVFDDAEYIFRVDGVTYPANTILLTRNTNRYFITTEEITPTDVLIADKPENSVLIKEFDDSLTYEPNTYVYVKDTTDPAYIETFNFYENIEISDAKPITNAVWSFRKSLYTHLVLNDKLFYKVGMAISEGQIVRSVATDKIYVATADVSLNEERRENGSGKLQRLFEYELGDTVDEGELALFIDRKSGTTYVKRALMDIDTNTQMIDQIWKEIAVSYDPANFFEVSAYSDAELPKKEIDGYKTFRRINVNGSGSYYNGMFIMFSYIASESEKINNAVFEYVMFDYNQNGKVIQVSGEEGDLTFNRAADLDKNMIDIETSFRKYSSNLETSEIPFDKTGLFDDVLGSIVEDSLDVSLDDILGYNIFNNILDKKIILTGGNDGSLFKDNGLVDTEIRNELLRRFFEGGVDSSILSYGTVPSKFTFYLGTNTFVMESVSNFTKNIRDDVFAYMAGIDYVNALEARNWRKKTFTVDNSNGSLRMGWKTAYDVESGQFLRMPLFLSKITDLASSIEKHGIAGNVHAGFNGEGIIKTGDDKLVSWNSNEDRAYLLQLNVPIEDEEKYYFTSNRTLQQTSSKLSMEYVSQSENSIKTELVKIGKPFINKFITDDLLQDIEDAFNDHLIENWLPFNAIRSVEVSVTASEYQRKNNRASAVVGIVFNNILERLDITIEIY